MGLVIYPPRFCKYCGAEFTPKVKTQIFCCKDCRLDFEKENSRKKYIDTTLKFQPVMEFIQKHYEATGKYLHYGDAVAMLEQNKQKGRRKT